MDSDHSLCHSVVVRHHRRGVVTETRKHDHVLGDTRREPTLTVALTGIDTYGVAADARALEDSAVELYQRYYMRLVRVCERRLGDTHLAEDVAQEALLRALRYLGGYDPSRPIWPWLRKIGLRVAYQASQKRAAERCSEVPPEDLDTLAAAAPTHDVEQSVVLWAALEAVPARQRAALVVRYLDDLSTADSARLYGLRVPAFEQLLWRARRRLSAEYQRIA